MSRVAFRRAFGGSSAGQATVELVAMLPVLAVIALAIGQLLAAGAARELAGHAAEAGAIAMLERGADAHGAADAARAAVPGWARSAVSVRVTGRDVAVIVRPLSPIPALSRLLAARATASAGSGDADERSAR